MALNSLIGIFLFGLIGYLLGSLPFAIWVTKIFKGIDLRERGSGHATATNTVRQAGWLAGALVLVLDGFKGFAAAYLAYRFAGSVWAVPVAAGLAVVGHCWPFLANFRGGMGLATTGGAFLAVSPLAFMIGFGILLIFVLVLHHAARGSVAAGILTAPALALLGMELLVVILAAITGVVIAIRFFMDWHRHYRELWLDRS